MNIKRFWKIYNLFYEHRDPCDKDLLVWLLLPAVCLHHKITANRTISIRSSKITSDNLLHLYFFFLLSQAENHFEKKKQFVGRHENKVKESHRNGARIMLRFWNCICAGILNNVINLYVTDVIHSTQYWFRSQRRRFPILFIATLSPFNQTFFTKFADGRTAFLFE